MASSILTSSRFAPLFCTQFCGAFNDNLLKNALVILVAYRSVTILGVSPEQMVALAGGIFILPFFLLSATAGQLADSYDKAQIIRWVKWFEILIIAISAAGFAMDSFATLLGALFLMGVQSTFFGPVKYSILPQHLGANELVIGNAWIEAGTFLAILLGTLVGGLLVAINTAWVSTTMIAVGLLGLIAAYGVLPAPSPAPTLKIQWDLIRPTVSMLRLARKDRKIWNWILAISWFWYFGATVLSLLPILGKTTLSVDESVVTIFLALFSVGIGVGSVACAKLTKGRASLRLSICGALGMSVCALGLCWALAICNTDTQSIPIWQFVRQPRALLIFFGLFSLAFFSGLFIVPLYTLIQEKTELQSRSRVIAANNIVNALFMVIAALALSAVLGLGVSTAQVFGLLAGANIWLTTILLRRYEGLP